MVVDLVTLHLYPKQTGGLIPLPLNRFNAIAGCDQRLTTLSNLIQRYLRTLTMPCRRLPHTSDTWWVAHASMLARMDLLRSSVSSCLTTPASRVSSGVYICRRVCVTIRTTLHCLQVGRCTVGRAMLPLWCVPMPFVLGTLLLDRADVTPDRDVCLGLRMQLADPEGCGETPTEQTLKGPAVQLPST